MAEYIGIDNAVPGQKLAKPVFNKFKQVLLQQGVTLDEKNIKLLKVWGVTMVCIESEEKQQESIENIDKEEIIEQVRKMFLWEPTSEFEKKLFNFAVEHKIKLGKQ